MRAHVEAVSGVLRRDAILFLSYRTQVVSNLLSQVFTLTLFYFISKLLTATSFGTPGDYFAFVVVGLMIVQVLTGTLGFAPGAVRQELVAGTLERFLVSPFGVIGGVIAMMAFPLVQAILTGAVMLTAAALIFGLDVAPTAPLAIPVALLGAFAFLPFALALVAAVLAFKQAAAGSQFIAAGIAIVGGLYFPVSLLPGWIRWTSEVQPFTPAADLLRHLLVATPLGDPVWLELVRLLGFGLILLPVGLVLLRRAVRHGQRRGTIIEY